MATVNNLDHSSDHEDTDWMHIENGAFKGVSIIMIEDRKSGKKNVIQLSTRFSKDSDRWTTGMPSLDEYPSLQILDLHNSRYLTELHDSVTDLRQLRELILTSCSRLERLPNSLGKNENLQEVRVQYIKNILNLISHTRLEADSHTFLADNPYRLSVHFISSRLHW
jgi:hypothetical protein